MRASQNKNWTTSLLQVFCFQSNRSYGKNHKITFVNDEEDKEKSARKSSCWHQRDTSEFQYFLVSVLGMKSVNETRTNIPQSFAKTMLCTGRKRVA